MCIIAIKPTNKKIDWRRMRNMWDANPDGAGFAYHIGGGRIQISKGYMTFKALRRAVKKSGIGRPHEVMFHFRIATHGGVAPECTHPFPLAVKDSELQSLTSVGPVAIAHNGIVPGMTTAPKLSDTMAFIKDYLAPLGVEFLTSSAARPLIEYAADSKLAIMTSKGIVTMGRFVTSKGWRFSNETYKDPAKTPAKTTYKKYSLSASELDNWHTGYTSTGDWGAALDMDAAPVDDTPDDAADLNWAYCYQCNVEVGAAWEPIPDSILCDGCANMMYVS
jgi:predicted glutamine amidotransferase